jgi:hypothetical protein
MCFWNCPIDQVPGLRVLCYQAGRIASPVRAHVITITIFSKSKFWELNKKIYHNRGVIVKGVGIYPMTYRQI